MLRQKLHNEFSRINMMQAALTNDWDINRLSNFSDQYYSNYDRSQMILRVENKLYDFQTSSRFVQKMNVIIPSLQKSISAESVLPIDTGMEKLIEEYRSCRSITRPGWCLGA